MSSSVSSSRRAVRGVLALIALAALGAGATPTAAAPAGPAPAPAQRAAADPVYVGAYNVRAVHSGKCLAPEGDSAGEGVAIHQQPCDGRPGQRVGLWSYGDFRGTVYYALVTNSGQCWGESDWVGPVPVRDLVIRTKSCNTYWKRIAYSLPQTHPWAGKQILTLVDPYEAPSPLCLHVHNASAGDGAGLLTHPCNNPGTGARNDSFEFLPL
ncbi:RICIN domain-containing protein [Streptomyces sp. NPDC020965]|uniref:RICIN domain-containing protein n=1 Tax=Streptomyces sp. NPDC020965 TaxID=3365105 RepID=UPI0037ADB7DD